MGIEQMDYTVILADLEAKRAALDQTIASFRNALAIGALGQPGDAANSLALSAFGPITSSISGGEVPDGAFLGKSIPDAAKLYLEIVKKKQTSKEIAEALLKGGMESASKNFPAIVHAILDRARKAPNSAFVKLGTQWGLSSWYPKGFAANAATKPGKKKQQKKAPKKKESKAAVTKSVTASTEAAPAQPVPINKKKKGATADRIVGILQAKPGVEYTAQQIGEQIG